MIAAYNAIFPFVQLIVVVLLLNAAMYPVYYALSRITDWLMSRGL